MKCRSLASLWGGALLLLGLAGCSGSGQSSDKNQLLNSQGRRSVSLEDPKRKLRPIDPQKQAELIRTISQDTLNLCLKNAAPSIPYRVLDQGATPWCAGFSTSRLFDPILGANEDQDHTASMIYFAALSMDNPGNPHLGVPLFEAVAYLHALENLQRNSQLFTESLLPFDPDISKNEGREQFLKYFRGQLDPKQDKIVIDTKTYRIEVPLAELADFKKNAKEVRDEKTNAVTQTIEDNFITSIRIRMSHFGRKVPKGKVDYVSVPAFNFTNLYFTEEHFDEGLRKIFEHIVKSQEHFVRTTLCSTRLPGAMKPILTDNDDACGRHSMNLLDLRSNNGTCEVLVANSWGAKWHDRGTRWMNLASLFTLLPVDPDKANRVVMEATYLQRRKDSDPIDNLFLRLDDEVSYEKGQTNNSKLNGQGIRWNGNNDWERGTFKDGFFISGDGVYTAKFHGEDAIYSGQLKEVPGKPGFFHLEGDVTEIRALDGRLLFKGSFENGRPKKGTSFVYDKKTHKVTQKYVGEYDSGGSWLNGELTEILNGKTLVWDCKNGECKKASST